MLYRGLKGVLALALSAWAVAVQPVAAQMCWDHDCGPGWGWGLVGAIAWDDGWDGDPWYDDGQFGAGEVAIAVMALGLIAEAADQRSRESHVPGEIVSAAPQAGLVKTVPPGRLEARSVNAMPEAPPAEGLVGEHMLAGCDRFVIDHREYRLCGRTWYARQMLWSWGPVPTPPGVTMQ
jgi:hypothetical protein